MRFYLVGNTLNNGHDLESGNAYPFGFDFYGDGVLPVFTSPKSFIHFLEVRSAHERGPGRSVGFGRNPFELADMIRAFYQGYYKFLYFDPLATPDGGVCIGWDLVPVEDYCSSIEEIRPEFEKLSPEAAFEFKRHSNLTPGNFIRWTPARAEDIAGDLRARIEEWIVDDDC